jgi:hypothetical protein
MIPSVSGFYTACHRNDLKKRRHKQGWGKDKGMAASALREAMP